MNLNKYATELLKNDIVEFRPYGHSMIPIIHSGDLVTVSSDLINLSVGDIVLCRVNNRYFLHKIIEVKDGQFLIGNNRGGTNGWTTEIFGRVIRVRK